MTEIEQYVQSYFDVPTQNLEPIASLFREKSAKRGDYLLRAERSCDELSFIKDGYVRIYTHDVSGDKEITQWISDKGSFLTDLASFTFDTPARWNMVALTDCELYSISKTDYRRIGDHIPNWDALEKLFLAKCFITLETRVFHLLSLSAEERYNAFFEQYPHLFNQVPLQYLASLLGMSPETFSRIRAKRSS